MLIVITWTKGKIKLLINLSIVLAERPAVQHLSFFSFSPSWPEFEIALVKTMKNILRD